MVTNEDDIKPKDESSFTEDSKQSSEKKHFRKTGKGNRISFTIIILICVGIVILALFLPVLKIYGSSMSPTLSPGDIIISVKGNNFERGDIIAFRYNNKILVKRVIALAGDTVSIDIEGNVRLNDEELDEPYISEPSFGECNIPMPYTVPESRLFVMGDNRKESMDSRNVAVGCVAEEQVVGKAIMRIWHLSDICLL